METIHPDVPSEAIPSSTHSQLPHHSAFAPNLGFPFYTNHTNTHVGTPQTLLAAQFQMGDPFSERSSSNSTAEGDILSGTVAVGSQISIDFKTHSIVDGHEEPAEYDQVDTIHPGSHPHSCLPVVPLYGIGDQFDKMSLIDPNGEVHCSVQEQIDRDVHSFRPAGDRDEGKWSHLV
ncbi:hypothetical protein I302_102874 [Kwoniella bestiolae CBS 10118]|uniref:Uncharacterized protein n=1 Tax=Kwoniella bestiolae CBS 10118 TaxID=1296100 RepID=A0A1B9GGG0_9TREE|nr:hypothetical protein I302_01569 [Kwoniella bestiolae CBS 10118]OCF30051.1 hypothetical protein I302_01569 [Kwoniella bestiolae CBS 10118]